MQSSCEGVTHFLQAEFRDEGLKHETSALKLFTVATTVSLEYYPFIHLYLILPIILWSDHTTTMKASQFVYRKRIKEGLMRATSKLLKTSNKGTLGKILLLSHFFLN